MPNNATLREFRELAWRAGGRDLPRIEASACLAIHRGMTPAAALDCLTKNAPHLFDDHLALERQRLPLTFSFPRRQSASTVAPCGQKESVCNE
jgi:hypothetical protein